MRKVEKHCTSSKLLGNKTSYSAVTKGTNILLKVGYNGGFKNKKILNMNCRGLKKRT